MLYESITFAPGYKNKTFNMKKIFTLIVALVATTAAMAQMPSSMNFSGKSTYSATIMGITASGGNDNDTLTVSAIDATNMNSSIAIPSMTVSVPGMFTKTIPAMALTAVPFTMSYAGGMTITWSAASLSYTVKDGGEDKSVTVTDLSGTYSSSTKTMSLTFKMKYGSMPGELSFSEQDAAYLSPSAISQVTTSDPTTSAPHKALVNGRLVIINGNKQYDAAGAQIK